MSASKSKGLMILLFAIGLVSATTMLVGCERKFTRERWETIHVGSADKHIVQTTLGEPTEKPFNDLWWYFRKNEEAKIYFDDHDVVKAKKWMDVKNHLIITEPKDWVEK